MTDDASQSPKSPFDLEARRERRARVTEQVPWIGEAWRWYDVPFRFANWLLQGPPRRLLGWRTREAINRWLNWFIPFNEFDRAKADALDDWMHNLRLVPTDEHVRQGGIWLVDLVPPSHYARFIKALRRDEWDRGNFFTAHDGTKADQLNDARTGQGWVWWRLANIVDPDSGLMSFDNHKERLPKEFSLVDVRAVQVGSSLTMVTAFFRFNDLGARAVDAVWHAAHEPTLTMRGRRRPHVEGREFASIRAVQSERQRLHDVARHWLSKRCPGALAHAPGGQPIVDLSLFDRYDPTEEGPDELREPLRALGLSALNERRYLSPELPGVVLVPSSSRPHNYELLHNCWTAVGRASRVEEENDQPGYGEKPYSPQTLAHMFDEEMRALLMHLAVLRYLDNLAVTYARARDLASSRHGRYRARQIEQLRTELLTTSLDLSMTGKDSAALWSAPWRSFAGVEVIGADPLGLPAEARRGEDFDFIAELGKARTKKLKALEASDRAYRDVLVTVASLGSSVEASRMGKRALWVAAASLGVAVVTLLMASTGTNTVWSEVVHWLQRQR